jgi:hypothetical protein
MKNEAPVRKIPDINTCRDYMCHENPTATPEEAAFALWSRYPNTLTFEAFLQGARAIQELKDMNLPPPSTRDKTP